MTLPLVFTGFVVHYFELREKENLIIGLSSILFGLFLYVADQIPQTSSYAPGQVPLKDALILGFFQILSLIPGASRLGSCLTGGRLLGYSRTSIVHFFFFSGDSCPFRSPYS